MHIHLDPVGGISGDMFAAALLDAWPELERDLLADVHGSGLGELVRIERLDHRDAALTGSRFRVVPAGGGRAHEHRAYREVRSLIDTLALPEAVRAGAREIFALLADAEARVHGVSADQVTFHEVGAWDSIADVVVAAWLVHRLGASSWSCACLPLGGGQVPTAHGSLPVPAPATAVLLEGLEVHDDGVGGERVTPTGAAILRVLEPARTAPRAAHRLARSGSGFGTRELEGLSNVLRVLVLERAEAGPGLESLRVCEFEVDDQTPEDLSVALEALRATEGVLDAVHAPVHAKKGRTAFHVRLLVEPGCLETVVERCFRETTTLGVRWHEAERAVLPRSSRRVEVDGRTVRVKRAARPRVGVSAKAEMDDLTEISGGHHARESARRRAERAVANEGAPAPVEHLDE